MPFPSGPYKITNAKNGHINIPPILPTVIPVQAAPHSAVWQVENIPQTNLSFKVHHLIQILKDGQPANLKSEGFLLPSNKGTVVIHSGERPDVWCLHHVFGKFYLIYFVRKAAEHHGESHWQLLSSEPGTDVGFSHYSSVSNNTNTPVKVIVSASHDHPINKLLHGHIIAGLEGSLDELTEKLKGLHEHHLDCFWLLEPCK